MRNVEICTHFGVSDLEFADVACFRALLPSPCSQEEERNALMLSTAARSNMIVSAVMALSA
jgi:hypothetical protein